MRHITQPYVLFVAFLVSCANVTTPEGGPKDIGPPQLERSIPNQNQTNYKGTTLEFIFDEPIQANNPKEEIIIIPPVGKKTEFSVKSNRLTITPENPWKENTTYTISFREGIKDVTEGNIVPDLQFAFSTGPEIDSLTISGTIVQSMRETIPDKITVAIYQSDTFNIFEHTPEYFTKSNKTGQFRITNLKQGTYRLYAFDDKNKNLRAESKTERFGFLAAPVQLDSVIANSKIALVNVDSRPLKLNSTRNQSTVNTIRFNKPVLDYQLEKIPGMVHSFGTDQSEVVVHYPALEPDSILISLTSVDSIDQKIDTAVYIKRDDRPKIKESFSISPSEPTLNLDTDDFQFSFSFNKPILSINQDSLYLELDTLHSVPLNTFQAKIDTVHQRAVINAKLVIPDSLFTLAPKLRLGKGYLVSIDQDTSRTTSANLRMLNAESTAVLIVEVQTKEKNFFVQLINATNEIVAEVRNEKKITFKYLKPEILKARLIIDSNSNGIWDTANYPQNKEPEKTVYYLNQDKKVDIPLRANWEVGPLLLKF